VGGVRVLPTHGGMLRHIGTVQLFSSHHQKKVFKRRAKSVDRWLPSP